MIPETGHLALILALCLALVQGVVPMVGAARSDARLMSVARPASQGMALFVAIAFGCLSWSFVANDFSVQYVAQHSNTRLPPEYRIAAVWGGHEGSLLLWVLLLAAWGVAVSLASRTLPDALVARVLAVMGLVSAGFLAFLLFASNPFERSLPGVAEGRDLNPLLQDPGMIFHPPLLYMGYVGFSVVFAFAIAALLDGRLDAAWARWSRPWTTAAWVFLTLGIALGSYWAYYELGWGGWWFWDPVENASFVPWLIGTALIHSLSVTEKRGAFKAWTILLAIGAFSMSLMGTFLVRSGVLTSVHAFATDPRRGVFILTFLAIVIGASLCLFAWRAPQLSRGGVFEPVSRESMLLLNNALFSVAAAAVMLGTLYPLVLDALGLGKISVGPPYFESVFAPLVAPAVALMGIGPLARWKSAHLSDLFRRLRPALLVAVFVGTIVPMLLGRWSAWVAAGVLLAVWVIGSCLTDLVERVRGRRLAGWPAVLPRSWVGFTLAHLGVAVFILGVTISKGYSTDLDLKMQVGQSTEMAGYRFRFDDIGEIKGANYIAARATISVFGGETLFATLHPEKRLYLATRMPMTEAAIDAGFLRHLYVSLGEAISPDTWVVRLYAKPLIGWIWGGCLMMALGGALAASDRRYRLAAAARRGAAQADQRIASL
jgi:cytochrome c-type biogenesis protein CcmF